MCRRDDNWTDIRVSDLVVGDLIQLKGGDVIPADAKVKPMHTLLSHSLVSNRLRDNILIAASEIMDHGQKLLALTRL